MKSLENILRSISYSRLVFFIIIGLIAILQYIQTQSPSSAIESVLAILGIIKGFFPGGTVKLPDGEVVSTVGKP